MGTVKRVQILDEPVCTSLCANALGKEITTSLLPLPQLWVNITVYLILGTATNLREGKQPVTAPYLWVK